jgi:hypothetical protein
MPEQPFAMAPRLRAPCAALISAATMAALPCLAMATAPADPLDAKAPVPAVHYQSTLKRSAAPGAERAVSWREANDTVTRIGGWRAYAREAQAPQPAASAAPIPAPSPSKPGPHSGHKMP